MKSILAYIPRSACTLGKIALDLLKGLLFSANREVIRVAMTKGVVVGLTKARSIAPNIMLKFESRRLTRVFGEGEKKRRNVARSDSEKSI